jgi:cysteine synthase A
MAKFQNILETVGNTPVVRINRLAPPGINLFAKIEAFNPLGSVKDRLALGVIEAAEQAGQLKPGQTVIEATSGNTGIGLAMVCAQKGYPLVITMAETFSVERRKLMRFLGAKVVLTPAAQRGMGMVTKAFELAKARGWFLTRQFENEANPDIHTRTTAREILEDFKGAPLDFWVTGYGTGGTLKGVARVLAKERPDTKIVVCEPEDAQLLGSGIAQQRNPDGSAAAAHPAFKPHAMQGWTPDFIPKLTADAVGTGVIDRIIPIANAEGLRYSRELAQKEGIFVGIYRRRHLCRRAKSLRRCAQGRDRAVHAARHRRALSEHAAFRRYPRRHDRRRAGDFALDTVGADGWMKSFRSPYPTAVALTLRGWDLAGRFTISASIWRCRFASPCSQSRKAMSARSSARPGRYSRYQASFFVATIGNGATSRPLASASVM